LLYGDLAHDACDLLTATTGDGIDERPALRRQRHPELAPIVSLCPAANEVFSHEPVAHPRRSRWGDPHCVCESYKVLRSSGGEDDEGPVLGKSDLLGDIGERPCRHGHEYPARRQHGIDNRVVRLAWSVRLTAHTLIIVYTNAVVPSPAAVQLQSSRARRPGRCRGRNSQGMTTTIQALNTHASRERLENTRDGI
jgi:hypothetical protein